MTKYEVEWEASHMTIVEANSRDEAIKIVRQMVEMNETFISITDGPFIDKMPSEEE